MPVTPTYPGVYIEEVPSRARTITGVPTSIAAFIGRALRGPVDEPVRIQGFGDFERVFGGLWIESTLGYALHHYFLNGGSDAIVIRVQNGAARATISVPAGPGAALSLAAVNEGSWGNHLQAIVDYETKDQSGSELFNLTIQEIMGGNIVRTEVFRNLSVLATSGRRVDKVLAQESTLVAVDAPLPPDRPSESPFDPVKKMRIPVEANGDGADGSDISDGDIAGDGLAGQKRGLWALEKADIFNLLYIPPLRRYPSDTADLGASTLDAAVAYCGKRRATLLIDSPSSWTTCDKAEAGIRSFLAPSADAAIYYPHVKTSDPLQQNRVEEFAPGGVIAGVIARTDAARGVWKAPAGVEATLAGVQDLSIKLTDGENGRLNPLGLNCLRSFPVYGRVAWGARTTRGSDQMASEWKYLPVRRLALFIEESLYRGTQWVVFEPNDEPLWSQIRLNVGAFMHNLFRQGAFAGQTPRQAYLVECGRDTTTQYDIDRGIVNILVGFAPLKPAEFVMIKISQLAGKDQA